jgi:hypothetical protein
LVIIDTATAILTLTDADVADARRVLAARVAAADVPGLDPVTADQLYGSTVRAETYCREQAMWCVPTGGFVPVEEIRRAMRPRVRAVRSGPRRQEITG